MCTHTHTHTHTHTTPHISTHKTRTRINTIARRYGGAANGERGVREQLRRFFAQRLRELAPDEAEDSAADRAPSESGLV